MKSKSPHLLFTLLLLSSLSGAALAAPDLSLVKPAETTQAAEKKKSKRRVAESTMTATVKAPVQYIWDTLVDFDRYPEIFERLKSVNVTKREGNFVYIESHLKPHFFVKNEVQHTVNDLAGRPGSLKWELLDGNFKHVQGEWSMKPISSYSTELTYHLAVDPGPVVPPRMVSFVLHFVQREIFSSFVQYTEKSFVPREKAQLIRP